MNGELMRVGDAFVREHLNRRSDDDAACKGCVC